MQEMTGRELYGSSLIHNHFRNRQTQSITNDSKKIKSVTKKSDG